MYRTRKRKGRYPSLIAFFLLFSLLFFGLAVAGSGGHESVHESSHAGAAENVSHKGGHGAQEVDRSGDYIDLLARFINFALLVIILFVVIKKTNALGYFPSRIKEIKEKMDNLEKEKEEAEGKYLDVVKKLKDFEKEKEAIIEQARKDGMTEKERIINEAKHRVNQIIEQSELTIQQEIQAARDRLKYEVADLAAQKADEIIAREIKDDDQDRLVNEFIERVGNIH